MKPSSVTVRYRTCRVTVFPVERDGRVSWRFRKGKRIVERSTLEKAKAEARAYAESSFLSAAKLPLLAEHQVRAIQRMLDVDPSLRLVDDFLHWHARQRPRHGLADARREFLAAKRANAGTSPHHVRGLERHLSFLPDKTLADIGLADLPPVTGAPRTRRNRIAAWSQFFDWCRSRGYLPDEPTIISKLEIPTVPKSTPATWTPAELRLILRHAAEQYRPVFAIMAWAGLRSEEICPDPESKKSPLLWSDFLWDRGLIIVRPETAKTGARRVIPIQPCLAAFLPRDRVGRVGPLLPPHSPPKGGKMAETTRIGKLLGGWRRNALRHSFLSYRAAMPGVGIAQAAREAGNSESIAKRVYEDAKGADEAAEWFSCHTFATQTQPSPQVATGGKP